MSNDVTMTTTAHQKRVQFFFFKKRREKMIQEKQKLNSTRFTLSACKRFECHASVHRTGSQWQSPSAMHGCMLDKRVAEKNILLLIWLKNMDGANFQDELSNPCVITGSGPHLASETFLWHWVNKLNTMLGRPTGGGGGGASYGNKQETTVFEKKSSFPQMNRSFGFSARLR